VKTLFNEEILHQRVQELGRVIRADYKDETITAICVLKGSFLFLADLVRAIGGDVRIEFLGVSSYQGTESSGEVRITHDLKSSVEDQNVLIIEDIVDTGLTLEYLLRMLKVRRPRTLRVAALLDKPARRKVRVPVDYVGFPIIDQFVVGYGLDLDERFRNLPFVGIYEPDVDSEV
jgi:hypoxanthine phosphoribosyltransferase